MIGDNGMRLIGGPFHGRIIRDTRNVLLLSPYSGSRLFMPWCASLGAVYRVTVQHDKNGLAVYRFHRFEWEQEEQEQSRKQVAEVVEQLTSRGQ